MTHRILTALGLLCLASCVVGPTRKQVLDGMIGQSETVMVRRFGVPTRSYDAGGHHFVAYVQQQQSVFPGDYGGFGFGGPGFGGLGYGGLGYGGFGGFYGGFPTEVVQSACETTLEIDRGVVTGWSLHGDGC